jgi:hypothetical protein
MSPRDDDQLREDGHQQMKTLLDRGSPYAVVPATLMPDHQPVGHHDDDPEPAEAVTGARYPRVMLMAVTRVALLIALFLIGTLLALVNVVVHGASPGALLGTAVMVVGLVASLLIMLGETRSARR